MSEVLLEINIERMLKESYLFPALIRQYAWKSKSEVCKIYAQSWT